MRPQIQHIGINRLEQNYFSAGFFPSRNNSQSEHPLHKSLERNPTKE
jgi:hypothetical protein